MSQSA